MLETRLCLLMYFVNALLAFVISFIVFFKLIRLTNKEKSKSFGMNLLLHAIFKFCTTKRLFKCVSILTSPSELIATCLTSDPLTSDPYEALLKLSSDFNSGTSERSPSTVFPDKNVAKMPFPFGAKQVPNADVCCNA